MGTMAGANCSVKVTKVETIEDRQQVDQNDNGACTWHLASEDTAKPNVKNSCSESSKSPVQQKCCKCLDEVG